MRGLNKEVYVVVHETDGVGTDFSYLGTEKAAIAKIMGIANAEVKHPRDERTRVKRVFKLDEMGNVTHLKLTLEEFKPMLKAIPAESPR